ncbi:unnamed protein product [Blepharisma stoltei]|uniref:FYVE-type domain-containing protein n=1 Tax=Blepharisma stoltei TaxID=1481888 RepID=A0AAU9IFG7_9CILI|nr:unnamed protein product [Blepharisma stoltei]
MVESISFGSANPPNSLTHAQNINPLLIGVDPNADKDLYLQDTACIICKSEFGITKRKYRCKFCWRGVCSKCSEQKTYHPIFNIAKRICDDCFKIYVHRLSTVSVEYEVSRSKQVIEELQYYITNVIEEKKRDVTMVEVLKGKYQLIEKEIQNIKNQYDNRTKLREAVEEKLKENTRIEKELGVLEIENRFRRRKSRIVEDRVNWIRKLDDKLGNVIKDKILLSKEAMKLEATIKKSTQKRKEIEENYINLEMLRNQKENLKKQLENSQRETPKKSCLECIIQ